MPLTLQSLIKQYVLKIREIYGDHLKRVILYGSFARGDFRKDSDIDIMILLNLSDMEIKDYRHQLSGVTFNFNLDYSVDIKPIAKNEQHFQKWLENYPFYANVNRDGVTLYGAA